MLTRAQLDARVSEAPVQYEAVRGCSSCGEDHTAMHFGRLAEPVAYEGATYYWAGYCPTTRRQVLLRDRVRGTWVPCEQYIQEQETACQNG